LVATIRQDMIQRIITLLQDYLIAQEEIAWLQIYRKIVTYCDKIPNK